MTIEQRLTNLENLVYAFIKNQSLADEYKKYDIEGCRNTEYKQSNDISTNTENIDITTDTLDTVMGVVLPNQAEAIDEVSTTLDILMTNIIPEIIG